MGVQLALNKLDSLLNRNDEGRVLYTLGPIIHNPQVLEEYASRGVRQADVPEDIPDNAVVVIRAHGVPRQIEERLIRRGVKIIDATCPKVKKAQILIDRQTSQDRILMLFGEESHPEVKGLLSYVKTSAHVFGDDVAVLQTVCDATKRRQEEVRRICQEVDYMIVAGGFESGNTRRLVHVARGCGVDCLHVETPADLPLDDLARHSAIGLSAGASTPKTIIDAIDDTLQKL